MLFGAKHICCLIIGKKHVALKFSHRAKKNVAKKKLRFLHSFFFTRSVQ